MAFKSSLKTLWLPAVITLLLVIVFWPRLCAVLNGPAEVASSSQHISRLLEGSLLRYYVLDGFSPQSPVPNLAGWADTLQVGTAPDRRAPLRAAGPLHEQFSVQLDDQALLAPVAQLEQSFTVEFLLRHHGQGFVTGGNSTHSGSLISMGDGVYSGFVFSLEFPSNELSFQIGQPKPQPAVRTRAIQRIPQSVWTHISGTWHDGQLSVYVNGLLSGQTRSTLKYHEVARSSRLRAGYVGNGLGSARMDLQHFAIYRRAFSSAEILSLASGLDDSWSPTASTLLQAGDLLTEGRAQDALNVLGHEPSDALPDSLNLRFRYRRAECLRELGQYQQAEEAFAGLAWQESAGELGEFAAAELLALQAGVIQSPLVALPSVPSAPASEVALTPVDITRRFLRQLEHRRTLMWKHQFDSQILPGLQSACSSCHSAGQKGGLPLAIQDEFPDHLVCLQMLTSHVRSLNLATAAGIALYEALRQIRGW